MSEGAERRPWFPPCRHCQNDVEDSNLLCVRCFNQALRLLRNPDFAKLQQKVRNQRRELRRLNRCLREKTYQHSTQEAAAGLKQAAECLQAAVAAISMLKTLASVGRAS